MRTPTESIVLSNQHLVELNRRFGSTNNSQTNQRFGRVYNEFGGALSVAHPKVIPELARRTLGDATRIPGTHAGGGLEEHKRDAEKSG